jgi:hypothetical protein
MVFTDKLWLGAAAGAAGFGLWGDKNQDLGDRVQVGALTGLVAGAASHLIWPGAQAGLYAGKLGASQYISSMKSRYAAMRGAGAGAFTSAFHSYGTRGVFTGLGAVIGASMAGEDHRMQGAAIGGALGYGARSLWTASSMYKRLPTRWGPGKKLPTFFQTGFIAGLSTLAFAAGTAFRSDNHEAAAVYNETGGYDEYTPGAAPDSGVRERMRNINATGDMVLGAHGLRHG